MTRLPHCAALPSVLRWEGADMNNHAAMGPKENDPMTCAFIEARAALERGEVPAGAVIVRDGSIISRAGNQTLADKDPTAHAEILAIRRACHAEASERLSGCDLYVTLEPAPCARRRFPLPGCDASICRAGPKGRRGRAWPAFFSRATNLPPCAGNSRRHPCQRSFPHVDLFFHGAPVNVSWRVRVLPRQSIATLFVERPAQA